MFNQTLYQKKLTWSSFDFFPTTSGTMYGSACLTDERRGRSAGGTRPYLPGQIGTPASQAWTISSTMSIWSAVLGNGGWIPSRPPTGQSARTANTNVGPVLASDRCMYTDFFLIFGRAMFSFLDPCKNNN